MIGWALRLIVIWGAAAVLLYAVVGNRLVPKPQATVASSTLNNAAASAATPATDPATNSLVFHANQQGHVVLDGIVNGASVRFLVDTGATVVALSRRDAAAAGFTNADLDFRGAVATANGIAPTAPVQLRELRIGQFAASDVQAVVMEGLGISLLGQSFLRRLDSYEMRDGALTLSWH